jgi:hypothetical protein
MFAGEYSSKTMANKRKKSKHSVVYNDTNNNVLTNCSLVLCDDILIEYTYYINFYFHFQHTSAEIQY